MAKRKEPASPFGPGRQLILPPPIRDPLMFHVFQMWSMGITPGMFRTIPDDSGRPDNG